MKTARIFFASMMTLCGATAGAQTTLTYATHGYGNLWSNEMQLSNNQDPGPAGEGVVWDFSGLDTRSGFSGQFSTPSREADAQFQGANLQLEEFGNQFFFQSTPDKLLQVGFRAKGGAATVFTAPFEKMRYPFAYGDAYQGAYEGYCADGGQQMPVEGTYSLEADAYGTVIFPQGLRYDDALRVVERQEFRQKIGGSEYVISHVAYRWYVASHRFPVLSIVHSQWGTPSKALTSAERTAYNPVITLHTDTGADMIPRAESLAVFPNPAADLFYVRVFTDAPSDVTLEVVGIDGRRAALLNQTPGLQGEILLPISAKSLGLAPGAYLVRATTATAQHTQRIVVE